MDVLIVLAMLGGIVFLGFAAEHLFRKTKIPDVLILILAGVVLAQFYPIAGTTVAVVAPIFTTFALLFILFEGALRLKIKQLFKQLGKSALLSISGFTISLGVVYAVGIALGFSSEISFLLGCILGGTSSAVVIPMVKHLKLSKESSAVLTLESAITDVLCIVGTVVATQVIVLSALAPASIIGLLAAKILIALVVGTGAGFAWVFALRKWRTVNSYVLTIALLALIYASVEWLDANGAVACLAFGIVLGNARRISERLHSDDEPEAERSTGNGALLTNQQLTVYAELSFFVKTFFFIYLGMLIDFSSGRPFLLAAALTVALFLARPLAVWISRAGGKEEKPMVEAMFPKGLAAAVLVSVPIQAGIVGSETLPSVVLATVFFSIILCSIAVFMIQRGWFRGVYRWGNGGKEQRNLRKNVR